MNGAAAKFRIEPITELEIERELRVPLVFDMESVRPTPSKDLIVLVEEFLKSKNERVPFNYNFESVVEKLRPQKATEPQRERVHDVFICHSSSNKAFARKVANDLTAAGYKVWFDDFEMLPGDSLYDKIQDGIKKSAWFVTILSPEAVESAWCKRELHSALEEEFKREKVYVIPLLYKECEIPAFLKEKVYVSCQGKKYKKGMEHLLRRLSTPQ